MKESQFIEKNKEKWIAFEEATSRHDIPPGYLSRLFVQITDDMSYARTFYPNRFISKYLNGLAQRVFVDINKRSRMGLKNVIIFWKISLPLANYNSRKEFRLAILIFTLAFIIGLLSVKSDLGFIKMMLGEEYIQKTYDNISKGEPMGIYKFALPFEGFLSISLNNLIVITLTYIFGLFTAIGTIFVLLYNGVMIGAFQQFFVEEGLFKISFLTIWQHGALEVTSMIIAGAAGLTMGKGVLFPGTFNRMTSFRIAALRGLKVFVGIVPPIIIAAFIEAYFTRMTQLPDWLRLISILIPFGAMVAYYFIYPVRVARNIGVGEPEDEKLEAPDNKKLSFTSLNSNTKILEIILQVVGNLLKQAIPTLTLLAIIKTLLLMVLFRDVGLFQSLFSINIFESGWPYFFNYDLQPVMFFVNLVLMGVLFYMAFNKIAGLTGTLNSTDSKTIKFRLVLVATLLSSITNALFIIGFWPGYLILLFAFPILAFIAFVYLQTNDRLVVAVKEAWHLFFLKSGQSFGVIIKAGLLAMLIIYTYGQLSSTLLYMTVTLVNTNANLVVYFLFGTIFFIVIYIGVLLIIATSFVLYQAKREIASAENLIIQINHLGQSRKIFGYERE